MHPHLRSGGRRRDVGSWGERTRPRVRARCEWARWCRQGGWDERDGTTTKRLFVGGAMRLNKVDGGVDVNCGIILQVVDEAKVVRVDQGREGVSVDHFVFGTRQETQDLKCVIGMSDELNGAYCLKRRCEGLGKKGKLRYTSDECSRARGLYISLRSACYREEKLMSRMSVSEASDDEQKNQTISKP